MSSFKTIEDVWEYLDSIPMFQKSGVSATNFGLDNIQEFCDQIGNPEKDFKSIHVAGTNGKGTTCNLLEAVYLKAGFKTGMFTSPHLLKYNERVRVNGQDVPDERILDFFQVSERVLKNVQLTFFEISTALAFWMFSKEKVDIAIVETGLGGRLDSTNIIKPELSVITSIDIDHAQILGDTKEEIAFEKAGIIKKDTPVVIGNVSGSECSVLLEEAAKMNSKVIQVEKNTPRFKDGTVFFPDTNEEFRTQLLEPVNAWNIALAKAVVELLKESYPVSALELKEAIENFKGVSARFEKLLLDHNWYFSGAHNKQAINSLLETVSSFTSDKKILIFTLMKDKVNRDTLEMLSVFDEIYFFELGGERGARKSDIDKYLAVQEIDNMNQQKILKELKTELVIFTGSFYFYPTVKRWLN